MPDLRRGWDHVNNRPMFDGTFPLWEEDHGLCCQSCERVVLRGQPYISVPQGVYDNGDIVSRPTCVYCALGGEPDA